MSVWSTIAPAASNAAASEAPGAAALRDVRGRITFEGVSFGYDADGILVRAQNREIADAVNRGLELIRNHPGQLRKADLVLVTDGGSEAAMAPRLREQAVELGVTILGLGIGVEREWLAPWCDDIQVVQDLANISDASAERLFGA